MKTLESIQKTYKVFETLAKIAMILSFILAGTILIGVLGDFVPALTEGLLFLFAWRYFKQELADGTPFTVSGANQVRNLGIKTIVMPLVAISISAVIYECFGVTRTGNWDNGSAVVLGISLILFSLILRHGAELREANGK